MADFKTGSEYWFAIHPSSGLSGEPFQQRAPFRVILEAQTPKVFSWRVHQTGERFKQSTWPQKQLGKTRPPFLSAGAAQDFLLNPMITLDQQGEPL